MKKVIISLICISFYAQYINASGVGGNQKSLFGKARTWISEKSKKAKYLLAVGEERELNERAKLKKTLKEKNKEEAKLKKDIKRSKKSGNDAENKKLLQEISAEKQNLNAQLDKNKQVIDIQRQQKKDFSFSKILQERSKAIKYVVNKAKNVQSYINKLRGKDTVKDQVVIKDQTEDIDIDDGESAFGVIKKQKTIYKDGSISIHNTYANDNYQIDDLIYYNKSNKPTQKIKNYRTKKAGDIKKETINYTEAGEETVAEFAEGGKYIKKITKPDDNYKPHYFDALHNEVDRNGNRI